MLCPGIVGKGYSDFAGGVVDDLEVVAGVSVYLDPVNLLGITVDITGCVNGDDAVMDQVDGQGGGDAAGGSCHELVGEVAVGDDELRRVGGSCVGHGVDILFPHPGHHAGCFAGGQHFSRLDGELDGVRGCACGDAVFGFCGHCRHGNAQHGGDNQKKGNKDM